MRGIICGAMMALTVTAANAAEDVPPEMVGLILIAIAAFALIPVAVFIFWGKYIHASVSTVFAGLSLVAVFVYLPFVSNYAFWFLVLSYIMLGSNYYHLARRRLSARLARSVLTIGSLPLAILAVFAVFVYVPFVSNYAFWFLVQSYILLGCGYLVARLNVPPIATVFK